MISFATDLQGAVAARTFLQMGRLPLLDMELGQKSNVFMTIFMCIYICGTVVQCLMLFRFSENGFLFKVHSTLKEKVISKLFESI